MIVSLADAKTKLGITSTSHDTEVTAAIESLTSMIADETGRSFGEVKTVIDEYQDYSPRIFLDNMDINSVTSVKRGYGSNHEVTTTDIQFNTEGRVVLSGAAGHRSSTSDMDDIRVTYTYGIPEANVPEDMKTAALQLLKQIWDASQAGGSPTEKRITSEQIGTYRVTYAAEGNVDQKTSINDFNTVLRKYTWKVKC